MEAIKKKWTDEEIQFIKKNYQITSAKFVANALDRTIESVKKKAKHLRIIAYTPNKWTEEEIKFLKDNFELKGISYISKNTNHPKSSVQKKAKEFGLKYKRDIPKISKEELEEVVKNSFCMTDLIRNLNKTSSGTYVRILKRYINDYNIDTSHFDSFKNHRQQIKGISTRYKLEDILIENSTYNRSHLKDRLYKEGLKQRMCEMPGCGQGEEWLGKKISLILDHKNGINNDHRIENLRIVCPNCNAALDTHCGKNKQKNMKDFTKIVIEEIVDSIQKDMRAEVSCNAEIVAKKIVNKINQKKAERPPYDVLKQDIQELGYRGTGKKYGVSDNAIRKWMKFYEKYGE